MSENHAWTRRDILQTLAAVAVTSCKANGSYASSEQAISVSAFGAKPDASEDSTQAVRNAIKACPKKNGILRFSKGVYRFSPEAGFVLSFNDFDGLEIDGGGSLFLFQGAASPFEFHNVRGPHIHDLTVDWVRPPFSQGYVRRVSANAQSLDVEFDSNYPISGLEQFFSMRSFDTERKAPMPGINDYHPTTHSVISGQTVRFEFARPVQLRSGDYIVARHARDSVGLIFGESSDIWLEKIVLHSVSGMGFVGTRVTNAKFDACAIRVREGTDRLISSTADGIHFWGCRGEFSIRDCLFEGVGDDCANIHSFLLQVGQIEGSNGVLLAADSYLEGKTSALNSQQVPMVGDRIELIDKRNLTPVLEAQVYSVSGDIKAPLIKLDAYIPNGLNPSNLCLSGPVPRLRVSGSTFKRSAACGIVVRSTAIIESNSFEDLSWAGVNCQVDTQFGEGPTISDIIVDKNKFERCGQLYPGSVNVTSQITEPNGNLGGANASGNRNIRVTNNKFIEPSLPAISIGQTTGAQILGNDFEVPTSKAGDISKILNLNHDVNVVVTDNKLNGKVFSSQLKS